MERRTDHNSPRPPGQIEIAIGDGFIQGRLIPAGSVEVEDDQPRRMPISTPDEQPKKTPVE